MRNETTAPQFKTTSKILQIILRIKGRYNGILHLGSLEFQTLSPHRIQKVTSYGLHMLLLLCERVGRHYY